MQTNARTPAERCLAERQFWTTTTATVSVFTVAVVLLYASQWLLDREVRNISMPGTKLLYLEKRAAASQIAALTMMYSVVLYGWRVHALEALIGWLTSHVLSLRDDRMVSEAAALTDPLSDGGHSSTETDPASDSIEGVAVYSPTPMRQNRPRCSRHRRLTAILCVLHGALTHPLVSSAVVATTVLSIYVYAHQNMTARRSRETFIDLRVRILSVTSVCLCLPALVARVLFHSATAHVISRQTLVLAILFLVVVTLWLASYALQHSVENYFGFDVVGHMSVRLLGGNEDFCAAVGRHTRRSLADNVVWPVVMPLWLRDKHFWTASCESQRHRHLLSFLDSDNDTLVISAHCWGTNQQPRVFLERPTEALVLQGSGPLAKDYRTYVEGKYGTAAKALKARVIVRRHPKTKHIQEVELDPKWLTATTRAPAPKGSPEAAVRAHWRHPEKVLKAPLGASASYVVRCPDVDAKHSELHLYPLSHSALGTALVGNEHRAAVDANATTPHSTPQIGVDEPPGSVLFILYDSVSRQEAVRMLPLFAAWMRDFRDRQKHYGDDGFIVAEPLHHSTVGYNSAANMGPIFAGATEEKLKATFGPSRTDSRPQAPNENIFYEFKLRYGGITETTLTSSTCTDVIGTTTDTRVRLGTGHPDMQGGVDRHLYYPFCADESFSSMYSAFPNCLIARDAEDHSYDYLRGLLGQRARAARANASSNPRFFFDMLYSSGPHETTHSALGHSDSRLTAFMEHLERDLHFFDNPRNALIFGSDHGLHYGDYYFNSDAGKLERTTPTMLFVFHPEMLRRVDRMKHRAEGTSLTNFQQRLRLFNSQLDLHMTLRDILGIPDIGLRLYEDVLVKPTSYFDARDAVPRECADYRGSDANGESCTLSYCTE